MEKLEIKRETKEKVKNQSAITLIALVITIIVLLILAGITISTLIGKNGIINYTLEAKQKTQLKSIEEQAEMLKQEVIIENTKQGKDITREDIINHIVEEMKIPQKNVEGNLIRTEDNEYEIMVKEDNTIEVVNQGEGYVDAIYKAPAPESDFIWEELDDGTIRILEYIGNDICLNIPEKINDKQVTVIQNNEPYGSAGVGGDGPGPSGEGGNIAEGKVLKSLKIPDTVTIIEYASFKNNQIEELTLPQNLVTICHYAFQSNNIKNLEIPNNVTYIGRSAFSGNEIENIEIPEKVTYIGQLAFSDNQATNIKIPNTEINLDGGAFIRNNTEQIIYARTSTGEEDKTTINSYAGRSVGDLIIPKGVKVIQTNAFADVGITSVEIPEGVNELGLGSFTGTDIEKIIIPSTISKAQLFSFQFNNIKSIEFKGEQFINSLGVIYCNGKIDKIKVPYSNDGTILEYYKGLIGKSIIASQGVGSIVDQ